MNALSFLFFSCASLLGPRVGLNCSIVMHQIQKIPHWELCEATQLFVFDTKCLSLALCEHISVVCLCSASQHGANLLKPLVSLVASCRTNRQGAAVVLALRCLQQLCTAEVKCMCAMFCQFIFSSSGLHYPTDFESTTQITVKHLQKCEMGADSFYKYNRTRQEGTQKWAQFWIHFCLFYS